MLKEFPEHVEILRETLDRFVRTSSPGVDPFDRVVWLLEARLEDFFLKATEELEQAKASGDAQHISTAKSKLDIMSRVAWKHVWIGDEALYAYVQTYKDAL